MYNTSVPLHSTTERPDMDAFYATCDGLSGITRIEVGCWLGKVVRQFHDAHQVAGLLLRVPKIHSSDFWNIQQYKSGTLLIAPHPHCAAFRYPKHFPAGSELIVSLPHTITSIEVVNLRDL